MTGRNFILSYLFLLVQFPAVGQEVREYIDLQIHPTMHVPYPFFGRGLEEDKPNRTQKLKYRHQLNNVNYADYLSHNPGARILVSGALTTEWVLSRKRARRVILKQINYVNDFVADHSDDFAVARSPAEVRRLVHETDKTIVIHSIEGARKLVNSQADARFWAEQGVAFFTLVHLVDYKNGGAAVKPGFFPLLINWKALFRQKEKRGLTPHGKNAIRWLANAGIMTDLTHMSDQTRTDALDYMESLRLPPLATHDAFKPIQNHARGIPADEVLRIYQNDGLMALPVSGISLKAHQPQELYASQLDTMKHHCPGSIDSYKFTYEAVQKLLAENAGNLLGQPQTPFSAMTEAQKVRLALGFQTDFNGWVNHSRPRYGKDGCFEIEPGVTYELVELQGLVSPELLPSHWNWLMKQGVDLDPVLRASERFLQLWEAYQGRIGTLEE